MRHTERDGFILIMAILGVGLVAAAMLILAGLGNSLMFDADQAYVDTCNRNLTTSALAWAQHNRDRMRYSKQNKQIQLDVSGLDIADGNLRITVVETRGRVPRVEVNTEFGSGMRKSKRSDIYRIAAR